MMSNLAGVQGSQCICQLASQMTPHVCYLVWYSQQLFTASGVGKADYG